MNDDQRHLRPIFRGRRWLTLAAIVLMFPFLIVAVIVAWILDGLLFAVQDTWDSLKRWGGA